VDTVADRFNAEVWTFKDIRRALKALISKDNTLSGSLTSHTHTHAATTGQTSDDHHTADHASRHTNGSDDIRDAAYVNKGICNFSPADFTVTTGSVFIKDSGVDHGSLAGLDTGADHSYIDQDVTSGTSPTFDGTNFTGIPTSGIAAGVLDLGANNLTCDQVGLDDDDNSNHLLLNNINTQAGDLTLSIDTSDASRTLTITGNPTISDWFDQEVKVASTPAFNTLSLNSAHGTDVITMDADGLGPMKLQSTTNLGGSTVIFPGGNYTLAGLSLSNSFSGTNTFSGPTNFTDAPASMTVAQQIIHSGDTDTYIEFTNNRIDLYAANLLFLSLIDLALGQDEFVVNESSSDIDFRWESDANANGLVCNAGNGNVTINAAAVSADYDLMLAGDGVLGLKETATPTADANYGKIYTKNDDKLYFQDGAGAEHEVAFV
jgi:hypothetical protein